MPEELKVQERVEEPAPVMLVGDGEHEVLLLARLTTPAKPLTGLMVMVELPVALTYTLILVGLAEIVKS